MLSKGGKSSEHGRHRPPHRNTGAPAGAAPDAGGSRAGSARLGARFCARCPRLRHTDVRPEPPLPTQTGVRRVYTGSPSLFDSCGGRSWAGGHGDGPTARPQSAAPRCTQGEAGVRHRGSTWTGPRVPARRGGSRGSTGPGRGSPPPAALLGRRTGRNSRGGRPSAGPVLLAPGSATVISN